jgi:acyl-CoA thioesterase
MKDDAGRAQRIADSVGRGMYARDATAKALGIMLDEIAPGRARMRMTVRPDMVNGHDLCHGGMTFTLADTAFAYACNSYNRTAVAASCNIVFTAPAKRGDVLTAVAEEKALEGRSGVYDIAVTDQSGRGIALFRGHSRRLESKVVADEDVV